MDSLRNGGTQFCPIFDGLGDLAMFVDGFFEDVTFDGRERVFVGNVDALDLLGLGGFHEDLLLGDVLDFIFLGDGAASGGEVKGFVFVFLSNSGDAGAIWKSRVQVVDSSLFGG